MSDRLSLACRGVPRVSPRARPFVVYVLALALFVPPAATLAPEPARAGDRWVGPAAVGGAAVLLGVIGAMAASSQRARYYARSRPVVARPHPVAVRSASIPHAQHAAHAQSSRESARSERRHATAHVARAAAIPAAAQVEPASGAATPVAVAPAVANPSLAPLPPTATAAAEVTGPSGGSFH